MAAASTKDKELGFFHRYPDFITEQEIADIKKHDAWPIEAFTSHTNGDKAQDDAISGNTLMQIEWEDVLWPNDGSPNHTYLRQRLEEQKKKNKVEWVNTELIGDQECTLVRWKPSWNRLEAVIIECKKDKVSNKLKMYCMKNKLKYNIVKKAAIQKFADLV